MALRKRYLFVCNNRRPEGSPKSSCGALGSEEVHAELKQQLALAGLAKLGVRACTSSCLDVCTQGITILVEPDHVFLGHVTRKDVSAIVKGLAEDVLPAHLVLSRAAVDEG